MAAKDVVHLNGCTLPLMGVAWGNVATGPPDVVGNRTRLRYTRLADHDLVIMV